MNVLVEKEQKPELRVGFVLLFGKKTLKKKEKGHIKSASARLHAHKNPISGSNQITVITGSASLQGYHKMQQLKSPGLQVAAH